VPADKEKIWILKEILDSVSFNLCIIFAKDKRSAYGLENYCKKKGIKTLLLHGDINKEERKKVMMKFREAKEFKVMISSNVLARGVDVPQVDLVINWEPPTVLKEGGWTDHDSELYMHRVGRTARFGTKGVAVTIVEQGQDVDQDNMLDLIEKELKL